VGTCSPAQSHREIVYIVDDDSTVRDALSSLLRANGKIVQLFSSGHDFLEFERNDNSACLILDLKMPGMNGLDVQSVLVDLPSIPIIFITGRGDVSSTVRAMKGGAFDFLTKPIEEGTLLAAVESALGADREKRRVASERSGLMARYALLTPREREVLALLVKGLLNKQVAAKLGIAEYTVQVHRGHIMQKMQVESFAALVRLAGQFETLV